MREIGDIKFSFMWRHGKTGGYIERRHTLGEVMAGDHYDDMADNAFLRPYQLHAVRECTGLRDKSGTEICEGDIVSFLTKYEKEESEPRKMVASVDWDYCDTGFYFNTTDGKCPYVKTYHAQHIEVIGNKYEDPELLEE